MIRFPAHYPDSHGGVDSCVIVQIGGSWVNYHCEHLMAFICEVVAGIEQPTTAAPPTDAPDVGCHDGEADGWIRRPGWKIGRMHPSRVRELLTIRRCTWVKNPGVLFATFGLGSQYYKFYFIFVWLKD